MEKTKMRCKVCGYHFELGSRHDHVDIIKTMQSGIEYEYPCSNIDCVDDSWYDVVCVSQQREMRNV